MWITRLAILAILMAIAAGCGSGGAGGGIVDSSQPDGSGGTGGSDNPAPQPQAVARLDFGTAATSPESVIYGVELTLHLPAGVTVSADSAGELLSGVLQPVDAGATVMARYIAATATSEALVKINVVDESSGFPIVGKFATLSCIVPTGVTLTSDAFRVDGFSARDANGAVVPGVTPNVSFLTQ